MLKMDLEYEKDIFFIRLSGTLNNSGAKKINNYINPILSKHKIKKVIYNLKDLKNIDFSGVEAILNSKCIVNNYLGKIYFCEVNSNIKSYLERLHIKFNLNEEVILKRLEVN